MIIRTDNFGPFSGRKRVEFRVQKRHKNGRKKDSKQASIEEDRDRA